MSSTTASTADRLESLVALGRRVLFATLCLTVFVPRVRVGSVEVSLDDALAAALVLVCAGTSLLERSRKPESRLWLALTWWAVLASGLVFGILCSHEYLGHVVLPTEMWQYVKRMVFFYVALLQVVRGVPLRFVYRTLAATVSVALLAGLLQWVYPPVGAPLARTYGRTERQIENAIDRAAESSRVLGIAGNSIAWGGFSMFGTALGLAGLVVRRQGPARRGPLKLAASAALAVLGSWNVILSASRSALGGWAVLVFGALLLGTYLRRRKAVFLIRSFAAATLLATATVVLLGNRLVFFAYRWSVLGSQLSSGSGRADEVVRSLALLDSFPAWAFGVGKSFLSSMVRYTEVEPVYLLAAYGLIGLLLRYGILGYIFWCGLKGLRHSEPSARVLSAATVLTVCGYGVFSVGFFFFQEIYVGLLPWLLFGATVGLRSLPSPRPSVHRSEARLLKGALVSAALLLPTAAHPAERPPLPSPIILSYGWPAAAHGKRIDLPSVNVFDLLPEQGTRAGREEQLALGNLILNRVYPFRSGKQALRSEAEVLENLLSQLSSGAGVIIDEAVGSKPMGDKRDLLIRVLREARRRFPDKYIFVWGSSVWQEQNVPLLRVIRDECDIFIPELYLSEQEGRGGFVLLRQRLEQLERQAPGILGKTVAGLGLFPKMEDDPSISMADHLTQQLVFLSGEPLWSTLRGIAIYAPTYGDRETLRKVDAAIRTRLMR
ncbi:MAG: hypothetical protein HY900_15005 [Deltaproteobacteria bacterium]|nr:hypothetical protein [Deltaproteobacteria bacterium]